MLRQLHSLPGLIAALLVVVIAASGAILSLEPTLERADSTVPAAGQISVADLAETLADHYPGAEQIERKPSGAIVVYYSDGDRVGADVVDPQTGQRIGAHQPASVPRWVKNLHRSLLLDTPGRAAAGVAALLMLALAISGALLLAARLGGWRQMLRPIRGTLLTRHECRSHSGLQDWLESRRRSPRRVVPFARATTPSRASLEVPNWLILNDRPRCASRQTALAKLAVGVLQRRFAALLSKCTARLNAIYIPAGLMTSRFEPSAAGASSLTHRVSQPSGRIGSRENPIDSQLTDLWRVRNIDRLGKSGLKIGV